MLRLASSLRPVCDWSISGPRRPKIPLTTTDEMKSWEDRAYLGCFNRSGSDTRASYTPRLTTFGSFEISSGRCLRLSIPCMKTTVFSSSLKLLSSPQGLVFSSASLGTCMHKFSREVSDLRNLSTVLPASRVHDCLDTQFT